ncbi:hypothetical protein BZG02_16535 [Labilibaculum filiforme]|uniref:Uncharacterized protein n=1 Tax=Labilibaculum filiforme TaxID=1940526 RepID=A0A2N3HT64_9BACT|nr:DUF6261 family protein [Labilibaculum filiforme]PKQ61239.1 hypothetical protein BZG02_16535 [Labilibaculum filiforme]
MGWIAGRRFYTQVKTSLQKFEEQLNRINTVPETKDIEEADTLFNNAWRGLKFYLKAYMLNSDADKRKAANLLNNLCKIHDYNLHTESYQEQNAKAKMFLTDCDGKAEMKQAIETIGAQSFISTVQNALDAILFNIANRKSKEAEALGYEITKIYREALSNAMVDMFKYMESMSGLRTGGALDTIIKNVNGSIQKIEVNHKLRGSRNSEHGQDSDQE